MNFKKLLALSCIGFAIPTGINGVTDAGWAMNGENAKGNQEEEGGNYTGGKLGEADADDTTDSWLMSGAKYGTNKTLRDASNAAINKLNDMINSGAAISISGADSYNEFRKWKEKQCAEYNEGLLSLMRKISDYGQTAKVICSEMLPIEIDKYIRLYNTNLDYEDEDEVELAARVASYKTADNKWIYVIFRQGVTKNWGAILKYADAEQNDPVKAIIEEGIQVDGYLIPTDGIIQSNIQEEVTKINLPANLGKSLVNVCSSFIGKIKNENAIELEKLSTEYDKKLQELSAEYDDKLQELRDEIEQIKIEYQNNNQNNNQDNNPNNNPNKNNVKRKKKKIITRTQTDVPNNVPNKKSITSPFTTNSNLLQKIIEEEKEEPKEEPKVTEPNNKNDQNPKILPPKKKKKKIIRKIDETGNTTNLSDSKFF